MKNASREAAFRPLTASRENAIKQKADKGQKTEGEPVSRIHAAEVRDPVICWYAEVREQQHPALRFEAADNLRRAERLESAEAEHRAVSRR